MKFIRVSANIYVRRKIFCRSDTMVHRIPQAHIMALTPLADVMLNLDDALEWVARQVRGGG